MTATGQPQDRDERTGAELLRDAAWSMREDWDTATDRRVFPRVSAFHLAVADWLDLEVDCAAIEGAIYGPALAVARAYLAAPVSAGEPKEDA